MVTTPDKLNENVIKFTKYYDLSDGGRNKKLLSAADSENDIDLIAMRLITISPIAHSQTLSKLWRNYGKDKSGADHATSFKDEGNDISYRRLWSYS